MIELIFTNKKSKLISLKNKNNEKSLKNTLDTLRTDPDKSKLKIKIHSVEEGTLEYTILTIESCEVINCDNTVSST